MCELYSIFLAPNTCIKVSNYLSWFSFYCANSYISFLIYFFLNGGGEIQPWTGWWFSWNNLVGIYILQIYLSWQQSSVLYLNLSVTFKSVMQHYIYKFDPPPPFPSPSPHCPPHYPPPPSPIKTSILFHSKSR